MITGEGEGTAAMEGNIYIWEVMDGMITGEREGTAAMEGNIYMRGYGRDDN